MNEFPDSGYLKDFSLPRLLVSLNRTRATGTLVISAHGVMKKVFLEKGNAIFASSTYADDRLGEILLKVGKITVKQYDESVAMLKKTGRRQGIILVELGYLTPKDLFWGVKFQVKEIIHSLFLLKDGAFEFLADEALPEEAITLNMSMANLIYEGVKRIDNWTRIRQEMPDQEKPLTLSDDPFSLFQEIELGPEDRNILALLNGKRSTKQIIEESGLNSLDALRTLYVLWSTGIVTEQAEASMDFTVDDIDALFKPLEAGKDAESSLSVRIDGKYENLGKLSNYELLEVNESATAEHIKKSYYRLIREFHPDRQSEFTDPLLKDRLVAVFDAISAAYSSLGSGDAGRKAPAPADDSRAEEVLRKGIEETKKGNYPVAADFLSGAVKLRPENATYWNHLSFALSKIPGRLADAEAAMFKAIGLEPKNSSYLTNLGMLYMKTGKKAKAREYFVKALSLDPKNERAKKAMGKIG